MPDFTVVCVNINQKELTAMWLASVLKYTNEPINILIGENNCTDGSKEYFSKFDAKTIRQIKINIVHSEETLEFGKFLDILKPKVNTPFMVMIHNDGELKRNIWLKFLRREFNKNSNLAVISSGFKSPIRNHIEPTGKTVHLQSELCSWFLVYRMECLNRLKTSFEPVYEEDTKRLYDVGAMAFKKLRQKGYNFSVLPWWFAKGIPNRINNVLERIAGMLGFLVYEHYGEMSYFDKYSKGTKFCTEKAKKLESLKEKFKSKNFLKGLSEDIKQLFI